MAYHYLLILYGNYTLLGVIYFSLWVNHSACLGAQRGGVYVLAIQSSATCSCHFLLQLHVARGTTVFHHELFLLDSVGELESGQTLYYGKCNLYGF